MTEQIMHVDVPATDPAMQCRFPGCPMVAVSDGLCYGDVHEALREAHDAALLDWKRQAFDEALAAVVTFYNSVTSTLRKENEQLRSQLEAERQYIKRIQRKP